MNRSGYSLIEVIVAMLILVVGILAMAGSTGYVGMQLQGADLRTERSVAQQQVAERLRNVEFDNLVTLASGSAITVGEYSAWWDVSSLAWALKEVDVYTRGPGLQGGHLNTSVVDTVTIRIARRVE